MNTKISNIIGCITINLFVGNLLYFIMFPEANILENLVISFFVILIGVVGFKQIPKMNSKMKTAILATLMSLACLLVACVVSSIAMKMEFDNIFTAAAKGVVPLFIFAIVFMSPVWIVLAINNWLWMKNL